MLYLPLSKDTHSNEAAVAPGAVFHAEGQAAVRLPGASAAGVLPSQGVAGEIFVGFVIAAVSAAVFPEGYDNKVESFVVPSTGSVKLSQTPVAGQVMAYDQTAGAVDADASVAGDVVSGLTAGNTVSITYKYAMTVNQLRARQGDVQPGGYAGAQVGQIGLVKSGTLYTSEFDASVDWAAATAIKLAANGQITDQSGSGVAINGHVVAVPGQDVPFLGIEFLTA